MRKNVKGKEKRGKIKGKRKFKGPRIAKGQIKT
jgi:hypothetical protein